LAQECQVPARQARLRSPSLWVGTSSGSALARADGRAARQRDHGLNRRACAVILQPAELDLAHAHMVAAVVCVAIDIIGHNVSRDIVCVS